MKILAVDVGVGTQDIMFYDSDYSLENSAKMVLPSPTRIIAGRIRKHKNDLFINGETMGGGPVSKAIKNHLKKGYRVLMTENAARTIRDDLDYVKSLGVEIVQEGEKHPEISNLEFKDVDLDAIRGALSWFDIDFDFDYIGVAVQDHGFMKGMGDRNFRFMKIKEKLDVPRTPEEFAYFNGIPDYFTRLKAVSRNLKGYKVVLMDSKFAAVCGTICDEYVESLDNFVALDVGNGHTLAASFSDGKICGVFEHHTHLLTPKRIKNYVEGLVNGTLTHEQIHGDGGHGAWVVEPVDFCSCVVATGPQRRILQEADYKVHYAAPAGDVMMTGPLGLIKAIKSKDNKIGSWP